MLGSLLLLMLTAPDVSTAVTAGLGLDTTARQDALRLTTVVAARVSVRQPFPVGEGRLRLAPVLVPTLLGPDTGFAFQDLGSNIEVELPVSDEVSVGARLDPFNTLLRRPTFDWANLLGRPQIGTFVAPMLSFDVRGPRWTAFLAARLQRRDNPANQKPELGVDVIAGGSFRAGSVSMEARVARFDNGLISALAIQGVSRSSWSVLSSGRLTWRWRGEVGQPVDFVTYRDDPTRFERFLEPVRLVSDGLALNLSLEGGAGSQRLTSAETLLDTRDSPLAYGDLQVRAQLGMTRVFSAARISTATFVVHDALGLPPFNAFSASATTTPRWSVLLGADHSLVGGRLVPSVLLRVLQPASVRQASFDFGGNAPPPGFGGGRVQAFDGVGLTSLPEGATVTPHLMVTASLRYVPFEAFSVLGEGSVERNANAGEVILIRGQVLFQLRL